MDRFLPNWFLTFLCPISRKLFQHLSTSLMRTEECNVSLTTTKTTVAKGMLQGGHFPFIFSCFLPHSTQEKSPSLRLQISFLTKFPICLVYQLLSAFGVFPFLVPHFVGFVSGEMWSLVRLQLNVYNPIATSFSKKLFPAPQCQADEKNINGNFSWKTSLCMPRCLLMLRKNLFHL